MNDYKLAFNVYCKIKTALDIKARMVTLLEFNWHELLNPAFYIENGGLWLFLFIVFAETGLFAGFFFPVIRCFL